MQRQLWSWKKALKRPTSVSSGAKNSKRPFLSYRALKKFAAAQIIIKEKVQSQLALEEKVASINSLDRKVNRENTQDIEKNYEEKIDSLREENDRAYADLETMKSQVIDLEGQVIKIALI